MDPASSSSGDDDSSSENRHVPDPILVAISTINGGNGAHINEIYEFRKLQERPHDLMPNYRDVLEVELNRRVSENELEKDDDNLYKIIDVSSDSTDEKTDAESEEPVAVPDPPPNTSSDIPSSSEETPVIDMAVKAIRTLNDGNGADFDEICKYVEGTYNLDPDHRKLLEEYLGLSVFDNELEMVDDTRYKIVNVASENTNETTEDMPETTEEPDADSDDDQEDYTLPYGDMPEDMVIEAISTMDDGIGVDIDEIYEYIEDRYNIPEDYMEILQDELNKRVSENELEKVECGYKILDVTAENMDEAQSQAGAVADQNDPEKSSSSTSSGNTAYYDPVIDAISTINDGNGVDVDGILDFIKEKYNRIPPNYRKLLEDGLKRRVSQCILEKVEETRYKILDITLEKLEEISEAAAKALAVSDQKDLEAKEASEAADRAKKVLEENELVLQVAKEALDLCTQGD